MKPALAQLPREEMVEQFLERLWPADGDRCLVTITRGADKPLTRHSWVDSPSHAAGHLSRLSFATSDVYFGIGAYTGRKRTQANCVSLRLFHQDLDCGPGKPYATWQDGVSAVKAWCERTGFYVPTMMVMSGNGLQLFWLLSESITCARWTPLAQRLKSMMLAGGLQIDPSRAADAASLMRLPGTNNLKDPAKPKPVEILMDRGAVFNVADIERMLPVVAAPAPRLSGKAPEGSMAAGLDTEYPPADAGLIAAKCRQMASIQVAGGKVSEPLWRAGLSVLVRCADGDTLIHEWSKGDDRYDPDETRAKADGTLGPATCAHFAGLNPAGCAGCPHANKIASPILLGTELPEPEVREDDEDVDTRLNEVGPWRVTARGVRLKMVDKETQEEVILPVTHCPLWVVEARERARDEDEPDASSLLLQWHTPDGLTRKGVIRQADVYEPKALTRWLGDHNVMSFVDDVKKLAAYIQAVTRELLNRGQVRIYYDRLGWFPDGIVTAGYKVAGGAPVPVRMQSSTPVGLIRPAERGSSVAWAEAMRELAGPNTRIHEFAVLAGFGSPLLHLVGWQAAVLSLAGVTGMGKTTAMEAALSIFGDPKHMFLATTATENAVEMHMAAMCHLPFGVDEISRWLAPRIANFVYQATNGEGKAVLTKSREMVRPKSWALVPMVTTNSPLLEYQPRHIDEPVRRRVLELHFSRKSQLPESAATTVHNAIRDHHGAAGLVYLRHVLENKAAIRAQLIATDRELLRSSGLREEDRFIRWLIAAAVVGGYTAQAAGVWKTDPQAAVGEVIRRAVASSRATEADEDRVVMLLEDFLTERRENIEEWATQDPLSTDKPFAKRGVREPVGRYDPREERVYIMASVLRQHLNDHRLSMTNLNDWMVRNQIGTGKMRMAPGTPTVHCYVIPLKLLGMRFDD